MAKDTLKVGSSSQTEYVQLSNLSTGGPMLGLLFNAAGLKAYYTKERAAPVQINLVTQTPTGAWADGGFCEVDSALVPGLYRIDLPNLAVNTGRKVIVTFSGAGIKEVSAHYQLVAYNPDDSSSMGLSKFDSVALSAAGILAIWHQLVAGIVTANTIGKLITDNLNATITSRSTLTAANVWDYLTSGITTNGSIGKFFMDNWTAARAAFLDKLNVSGNVASQADINAINQSASRRITVAVVPSMERPESGSNTYTIELRLWTADGVLVNGDTTPTISATGRVSGSLSGNISAMLNPLAGVYRWTYTVANNATLEEVRFDVSAAVSAEALQASTLSQVADFVAATFTTTDRADIQAAKAAALAAQTRAELGIPNSAPGTANGLPRTTDLPVAPDNAGIATAAAQATTAATQSTAVAGKFAGITLVANWLRLFGRKSAGDATALAELNNGGGTFDPTTDSGEALSEAVGLTREAAEAAEVQTAPEAP